MHCVVKLLCNAWHKCTNLHPKCISCQKPKPLQTSESLEYMAYKFQISAKLRTYLIYWYISHQQLVQWSYFFWLIYLFFLFCPWFLFLFFLCCCFCLFIFLSLLNFLCAFVLFVFGIFTTSYPDLFLFYILANHFPTSQITEGETLPIRNERKAEIVRTFEHPSEA